MKVFISQPMLGLTEVQITEERNRIEKLVKGFYRKEEDIEFIDSWVKEDYAHPLQSLGESIKRMAFADLVVFSAGFNEHRGCRIEHSAARAYDITTLVV